MKKVSVAKPNPNLPKEPPPTPPLPRDPRPISEPPVVSPPQEPPPVQPPPPASERWFWNGLAFEVLVSPYRKIKIEEYPVPAFKKNELLAESDHSWKEAGQAVLAEAFKMIKDLRCVYPAPQAQPQGRQYRVNIQVSFAMQGRAAWPDGSTERKTKWKTPSLQTS